MQGGVMALTVVFLCILLAGSLRGLILPMSKPDGTADMSSLFNHISLLEQNMASLQISTAQLRTDLEVTKKELQNAQTELQSMRKDVPTGQTQQTTKMQDVAFQAHDPPNHAPAKTPLQFTMVNYNAGSGFDRATGKFTVPVSGTYMFWTQLEMGGGSNTALYVYIKKTGGLNMAAGYMETGSSIGDVDTSAQTIDHMEKGEQVWVEITNDYEIYNSASYFGGALLSVV
ncbi:C1q-related factor-like [Haliotis cracherodii]|uniref:C1q-related factor-like n=1 Tax=Haliotis cracherodii TaxID=6455 RepID=UPI0039EB921B